jgi:hypothetical protein
MMTDDEIIAASQQAAIAKMQARGWTNDQITQAQKSLAAPTAPNTVNASDMEAAWARSAGDQARSLGISPVSDTEAAAVQTAMDKAVAAHQAARAAELDNQLLDYRAEVQHDRAARSGLYYSPDAAKQREIDRLVEKTEIAMIETRLTAGLPANPAARKSPAEVAQERWSVSTTLIQPGVGV